MTERAHITLDVQGLQMILHKTLKGRPCKKKKKTHQIKCLG